MSALRKTALIVAGLAVLVFGGTWWLAGTESGTRWILERAEPLLPDQLVVGEVRGSFLRGLGIRSVDWRGETLRMSAREAHLDIKLLPLFFRHVAVNELTVGAFELEIDAADESDADAGLPSVDMPIGISIADASLDEVFLRIRSFTQSADDVSLAGSLFGSDLSISRFAFSGPRLGLDLDGRLRMAGAWPALANVAWQWRQSDTLEFSGDLQLQGDTSRYELQHALTAPVEVASSGSVSFASGTLRADLTNEWESLELPVGERRLQSSAGSLRLQGSTSDYAVELDAQARIDDLPETRIELTGDANVQAIRISSLRAVNDLGELAGSGNAAWLPERTIDMRFSLTGVDPAMVSKLVTGQLEFDGRVQALFGEQAPDIAVQIERMGGDVNGHVFDGRADLAYRNSKLIISDARLRAGTNRAIVSGTLGDTVSMNVDVDLPAISELVPEASGELEGRLALSGTRDAPDARVELSGRALTYAAYAIGGFTADAAIFQAQRSSAEFRFEQLSAGGVALESARVSVTGRIAEHAVRVRLNGYGGELVAEADGSFAEGRWSGRVASLAIAIDALGSWSGSQPGEIIASPDEIELSETCIFAASTAGRACLAGSYHREGLTSVDFSVSDLPLSALPASLPGDASLNGVMDARLQLGSKDEALTGNAGIELRDARIDAAYEDETISVVFSDAAGTATILDNRVDSRFRLEMANGTGAGDLRLTVQDLKDRQSAIGGRGSVSINDASLFAVFLPGIANPRGRIDGGLTISGTLAGPEFQGDIALTGGAFGVRQAGIEITGIEARLSQRAAGRLRLEGSARSGDGQVSIRGDTRVGADSGIRTEIVLTGEDFEIARLPDWQVAASPSITVVFDERTTAVSGELGIPAADITVKEIPESAQSPSPDAIVHRPEGTQTYTGRRLTIDVTTALGNDVRFSGFGLTAGLDGTVRIRGGTNEPYVGNGTLVLRDGRYEAYGQELVIEHGELLFNGPLDNPQLDIRAIRRANDVTAGIQLSGTPSQLRSKVFSEPALSDAEALSYLLTGRPLASASTAAEGDILNNAAFALGMTGAGRITSQVQSELGLETLTIEGGADDGRIIAGKRFGSRLLVEYGYGLIDKLGTLLLRYQLNDRIVLESRTGTVSVLDVVYSVKKQ